MYWNESFYQQCHGRPVALVVHAPAQFTQPFRYDIPILETVQHTDPSVHPFLAQQLVNNSPMLLAGECSEVNLTLLLQQEECNVFEVEIFVPGVEAPRRFRKKMAVVLSRTRPDFMVCPLPCCVRPDPDCCYEMIL